MAKNRKGQNDVFYHSYHFSQSLEWDWFVLRIVVGIATVIFIFKKQKNKKL